MQVIKKVIDTKIPGSITKQECDSYEYVVKEKGEIVTLSHRWVYVPESQEEFPQQNANNTIDKVIISNSRIAYELILEHWNKNSCIRYYIST